MLYQCVNRCHFKSYTKENQCTIDDKVLTENETFNSEYCPFYEYTHNRNGAKWKAIEEEQKQ